MQPVMGQKYRLKDEPNNTVCKVCEKPTWARTGTFTCYNGLGNYWNDGGKSDAISYFSIEGGVTCAHCWETKTICNHPACPLIPKHTMNVCKEAINRMGFK